MRVALVGNQNCGKTSLFNKLTGSNQKVGNWPGVTVEKKEGKIVGTEIEIIDLPGVYSLSPYTAEENITREFLLEYRPEIVLNVVDSTLLERSLFLSTQLLDLDIPVIVVLNMIDLLDKKGFALNDCQLSKDLGVKVIEVSARTGQGLKELIEILKNQNTQRIQNDIEKYPAIIENILNNVRNKEKREDKLTTIERIVDLSNHDENLVRSRQVLKKLYGDDLEEAFISLRYKYISKIKERCLREGKREYNTSDKLDKILLNKYLAIPIFILVMSLMYFLSIGLVGRFATEWLNSQFGLMTQSLRNLLANAGVSIWLVSLIVDGVITGVSSVLSFLPQLAVIFLFINLLETSGYMSRVVFVFDRLLYKLGLSGKSLISFIIGSGCSVPAISATRAIEQEQEKQKTIMLSPFIPCSAKLPIIALFVGEFFPDCSGLITTSLYFLAVMIIVVSSVILNKLVFKTKRFSFVAELPELKAPSLKYTMRDVFSKCKEFIMRAGTIILLCSVFIWFLSSFSFNLRFCDNVSASILAGIGKIFSWFFYPIIGEFNWAVTISAIQGVIAKEQVVSSMSIISGLTNASGGMFGEGVFSVFNPASAYAFVVFNLFSAPCFASIGAMNNELKSIKKTLFAVVFQTLIAWLVSSLIFQIGRRFI